MLKCVDVLNRWSLDTLFLLRDTATIAWLNWVYFHAIYIMYVEFDPCIHSCLILYDHQQCKASSSMRIMNSTFFHNDFCKFQVWEIILSMNHAVIVVTQINFLITNWHEIWFPKMAWFFILFFVRIHTYCNYLLKVISFFFFPTRSVHSRN